MKKTSTQREQTLKFIFPMTIFVIRGFALTPLVSILLLKPAPLCDSHLPDDNEQVPS